MPTCTPAALADAAKTFQGLSPGQKQAIDTYLLAVIAGGSTDPNTLALAAKDFQGIPSGMFNRVQAYLLCQIASGGGGGGGLDAGGLGYFTYGDTTGDAALVFPETTIVPGYDIEGATNLTSLSWPNLVSIDLANVQNGFFYLYALTSVTSVLLPLLVSVQKSFGIQGLTALTSISLPSLVTACKAGNSTTINQCTLLTSISLPNWIPTTGALTFSNFDQNALNAASVNAILASHMAVPTWGNAGETLNLNGGTNAAPSGQGIADKAALILRGATVNTN